MAVGNAMSSSSAGVRRCLLYPEITHPSHPGIPRVYIILEIRRDLVLPDNVLPVIPHLEDMAFNLARLSVPIALITALFILEMHIIDGEE